jgi:hypothetical protein
MTFDAVKKAGLSVDEFAVLVGVSRVAAFNWMASPPRSKPHRMISDRVEKALELLRKLVEKNKLPLHDDLTREERKQKIERLQQVFVDYITK